MRNLIAFEFISFDGFMAGPPGQEMDFVISRFDKNMEQDLVDEFRFFIFPVILGNGKPLFSTQAGPVPLKLLKTKHFSTGVMRNDYVHA